MSNGTSSGASGSLNTFRLTYEKRKIVVAQGLDFRDDDLRARKAKNPKYSERPLENFLKDNFTTDFTAKDSTHFEYISDDQQVHFFIEIVRSKEEFSKALDTSGIHVIYAGHSRYGRGTCFDPDVAPDNYLQGERWNRVIISEMECFVYVFPLLEFLFLILSITNINLLRLQSKKKYHQLTIGIPKLAIV